MSALTLPGLSPVCLPSEFSPSVPQLQLADNCHALPDNFEWASGLSSRFGSIHVDFDTMRRRIKDSAYVLPKFIQANMASA